MTARSDWGTLKAGTKGSEGARRTKRSRQTVFNESLNTRLTMALRTLRAAEAMFLAWRRRFSDVSKAASTELISLARASTAVVISPISFFLFKKRRYFIWALFRKFLIFFCRNFS